MDTTQKNINVLIIEDSEDDALLTVTQLKRSGYEVTFKRVETPEDLGNAVVSSNWDIILSDFQMPHLDGFEALSILKKTGMDIPFIILSGAIGEETAVDIMKKGACDYIMKNNLQRLIPAIEREIRESKNRIKQRRLEHKEKLMMQERMSHYRFFECMDKINRAIQGKNDLEQMMSEVLEKVLSIFDCDRAHLLYPCDPNTKEWTVPMKKFKPGYPGISEIGIKMPIDNDVAQSFRILLNSERPVMFGPGTDFPLPEKMAQQFELKNFMAMAIYPKIGKPWQFGIHQCSEAKIWTKDDERLFHEIGRRLTDGLSSMLMYVEKSIGEAENRAIINAVPDLLFRVNLNGTIIDYRKPEKMELYLPPEQFLGKSLVDILPENITKLATSAIKKAYETNDVVSFDYDLLINEKHQYFEGRVINFSKDEVLIVIRDITEQKISEEEIIKLSLAVEQSPVSIIITNPAGDIEYINPKFTKITGYSGKEVIGQNPKLLKSGLQNDQYYQVLWQTILSGNEWFGELCNKKKNGELFWEFASISPIIDSNGNITHFLAIKEDITQRKLSEEALQESERKYRIVADNTYSWEFWLDPDDNYKYCSPSCYRITGYNAKEFVHDPELKYNIIHSDYRTNFKNQIKNAVYTQGKINFQYKIIHKSGAERWIEYISRPVFDDSGIYLGQRGSNRDITVQKETDRKILDAVITTEENERNFFSQDLHDGLGPMLSTVKLYFQWLGETTDNSKRENIIKVGLQNIDDAIQAVREISNKLSPRILNNLGLIPALKFLVNRINKTQKIKINVSSDIEQRYNSQIEITLYRIFSELINNTLKYAKAGIVNIKISHSKDNSMLYVIYKDNGKGFNLDEILIGKKGMGIQNMKQRVETLNGIINFNTDKGKPLTVKIELPINDLVL